jgi:hypothetical protein
MSLTLLQVYTNLRERLGDDSDVDWSDAQLKNAIFDAMRVSWPYFYEAVSDVTTYAGSNYRAVNTTDVNVPAAFYSTTGPGKITRIEWRRYTGSGTNYFQWQPLRRGWWVDDLLLTTGTPQIHFSATRGRQFELKLYGQRPLTIPVADSDVVSGTQWGPFIVWLYYAAEKFARSARQEAQQYDTEAQSQRRIFATQDMLDLAKINRMRSPITLASRW